MTKKRPSSDQDATQPQGDGWITPVDLSRLTGLGKAQMDVLRGEFGGGQSRGVGVKFEIHAPTLFRGWWASWQDQRLGGKARHEERLKKAQADKAELELARARGELVHIADMRSAFGRYGDVVRQSLEVVGKISPEAQRVVMENLKQSEQAFADTYGFGPDAESDGGSGSSE